MSCITAVAALLALSACGFQLQGRTVLSEPLQVTYVQARDTQSDFVQNLRKSLLASGAQIVARPEEARSIVTVSIDEVTQRVLSVSARNLPREYEITYRISFVVTADDEVLMPAEEASVSRSYSFDERALLAKEHEEAVLREALARELVGIVMRRLASL